MDEETTDYSELEAKNKPITSKVMTTVFVVIAILAMSFGVVILNVFKWLSSL